jgi:hypothetical protein
VGDITVLARVTVLVGMLMIAESLGLLYIWMSHLGLTDNKGLNAFVFDMLIFEGTFTILYG